MANKASSIRDMGPPCRILDSHQDADEYARAESHSRQLLGGPERLGRRPCRRLRRLVGPEPLAEDNVLILTVFLCPWSSPALL